MRHTRVLLQRTQVLCYVGLMAIIKVEAWKCDLCGHVWIKQPGEKPKQCAKCRTRIWDCDGETARPEKKPEKMIIKPDPSPTERAKEIVRDPEPAKEQRLCRSCKAPLSNYKDGLACTKAACQRFGIMTP